MTTVPIAAGSFLLQINLSVVTEEYPEAKLQLCSMAAGYLDLSDCDQDQNTHSAINGPQTYASKLPVVC